MLKLSETLSISIQDFLLPRSDVILSKIHIKFSPHHKILVLSANNVNFNTCHVLHISLLYKKNSFGPRTVPRRIPQTMSKHVNWASQLYNFFLLFWNNFWCCCSSTHSIALHKRFIVVLDRFVVSNVFLKSMKAPTSHLFVAFEISSNLVGARQVDQVDLNPYKLS